MGKKKIVGAGKSKHWTSQKRKANKTRKLENRIKSLSPETQEKILSVSPIGRKRER